MNIMVFDVPAESGGALTILKQYYEKAINDKNNKWIFVISTPDLLETDKVKVLKVPWIKKSWLHRLYFDKFIAHKLVKKYEADEVLSLQNVTVSNIKVKQTLYLHQALPFVEKRYGMAENFKFWLYQNVISKMIYKSIREADKVVVQTKWIRDAAIEKAKVKKEKFILKQPKLSIDVKKEYKQQNDNKMIFFYPSSGLEYKNHKVIVEALQTMPLNFRKGCEVLFTLDGNENTHIKELYAITQQESLPIKFIGKLNIDEVYDYYSKSILIFPSYIETFGLPLLEAKVHNCPIIASDCAFSHEILEGYNKVRFFDPFDADKLSQLIKLWVNS